MSSITLGVIVAIMAIPQMAYANAGVPMLALAWPAQWLALIPIILVEAEVFRRAFQLPLRSLIKPIAKANLVSTLVGIPFTWLAMLLLEFTVGYIGFLLMPGDSEIPVYLQYLFFPFMVAWIAPDNAWQIYLAFVMLTVPFCIISILIERWILRRALPDCPPASLHKITNRANILSYVLLLLLALWFPLTS